MGLILLVVWIVLMILWLVLGVPNADYSSPKTFAGVLAPWLCVLILGIVLFGGYYPATVVAYR